MAVGRQGTMFFILFTIIVSNDCKIEWKIEYDMSYASKEVSIVDIEIKLEQYKWQLIHEREYFLKTMKEQELLWNLYSNQTRNLMKDKITTLKNEQSKLDTFQPDDVNNSANRTELFFEVELLKHQLSEHNRTLALLEAKINDVDRYQYEHLYYMKSRESEINRLKDIEWEEQGMINVSVKGHGALRRFILPHRHITISINNDGSEKAHSSLTVTFHTNINTFFPLRMIKVIDRSNGSSYANIVMGQQILVPPQIEIIMSDEDRNVFQADFTLFVYNHRIISYEKVYESNGIDYKIISTTDEYKDDTLFRSQAVKYKDLISTEKDERYIQIIDLNSKTENLYFKGELCRGLIRIEKHDAIGGPGELTCQLKT